MSPKCTFCATCWNSDYVGMTLSYYHQTFNCLRVRRGHVCWGWWAVVAILNQVDVSIYFSELGFCGLNAAIHAFFNVVLENSSQLLHLSLFLSQKQICSLSSLRKRRDKESRRKKNEAERVVSHLLASRCCSSSCVCFHAAAEVRSALARWYRGKSRAERRRGGVRRDRKPVKHMGLNEKNIVPAHTHPAATELWFKLPTSNLSASAEFPSHTHTHKNHSHSFFLKARSHTHTVVSPTLSHCGEEPTLHFVSAPFKPQDGANHRVHNTALK